MNTTQIRLYDVIIALLRSPDFTTSVKDSAIRYGFLNYVAKYSLAKEYYWVSPAAKEVIEERGFIKKAGLRRGLKSRKNGFTYEHPIPSNVIADAAIQSRGDAEKVKSILKWSDIVVILTSEEDAKLSGKLRTKMPEDWVFFMSDKYARYRAVGLDMVDRLETVPMLGSISR